jgi:hypothetical protein
MTRLKVLARENHSSLLSKVVFDAEKSFVTLTLGNEEKRGTGRIPKINLELRIIVYVYKENKPDSVFTKLLTNVLRYLS